MDDDAARHISREGLAALEAELRELETEGPPGDRRPDPHRARVGRPRPRAEETSGGGTCPPAAVIGRRYLDPKYGRHRSARREGAGRWLFSCSLRPYASAALT